MEVKTPEFFENVSPTKFKPDKVKGFQAVAQTNITGANGCQWIITIENQEIEIKEGAAPNQDIILKMVDRERARRVGNSILERGVV